MAKMTTEEAFVKVLQMHGIEHAFGIIGSAFMPISDIFPDAGITFWDFHINLPFFCFHVMYMDVLTFLNFLNYLANIVTIFKNCISDL